MVRPAGLADEEAALSRVRAATLELGYDGPNPLGRSLRSGRSGIVAVADPLVDTAPMDVAVLIWGAWADDPMLRALQRRGVPVVIGNGPEIPGVPVIGIQDREGTADLARHLLELGHRRIATMTLPVGPNRRSGVVDQAHMAELAWTPTGHRLQGLTDAGATPVAIVEAAASLVEAGKAAAHALLDLEVPATAVVAQSDLLASGVVLATGEHGLHVPEDLSVAGFDGLDLPRMSQDVLTTVVQPLAAKSEALAGMVAALIAGYEARSVHLGTELRIGTSTGPPLPG